MARYLSDLPESENEVHEYLFETWQMGYKICECTYNNLNEARRYYANNGDCLNYALRLYIDGKLVDFMKLSKTLKIPDTDKWRLNLAF